MIPAPTTTSTYTPYQMNRYPGSGTEINTPSSNDLPVRSGQDEIQTDRTDRDPIRNSTKGPDSQTRSPSQSGMEDSALTPEELRLVEQLQQIDSEVRQHEMAHLAAGGAYITSGATFTYKQGPDGQRYAVGGEVGIDISPVPGDPQATLSKMRQVRTAALAPANPSPQDLKVASNAASQSAKALSELTQLQAKNQAEQRDTQAFATTRQEASDAYTRVNTLPEGETSTIALAV